MVTKWNGHNGELETESLLEQNTDTVNYILKKVSCVMLELLINLYIYIYVNYLMQ